MYLPQVCQFTTGTDRAVEAPIFPGYLFVRGPFNQTRREAISSLPRVIGWVRFDGAIPTVPPKTVEDLKRRVDSLNRSGGVWRGYVPGEQVSVRLGTLDGSAEVLEAPASPSDRVNVLLRFMDQQVRASVPWNSLQPVVSRSEERGASSETFGSTPKRRRRTRGRGRRVDYVPVRT